tara:strand:+ start:68146 stop:68952 length:807 start_codon:yes stop_codon:yes gene_type:complete
MKKLILLTLLLIICCTDETASKRKSSKKVKKKADTSINVFQNFAVGILSDKKNINVRKKPVDGKIIDRVSGGEEYTVTNEYSDGEPVYLLNKKIKLKDLKTGEMIRKSPGFKLSNVKLIDDLYYSADIINKDGSVSEVVVFRYDVDENESKWYYIDEIGGWIYSSFCYRIKLNESSSVSSSKVNKPKTSLNKITFKQAEAFMQKRCSDVNQTLMKKKIKDFDGKTLYMFLSVAENGYVCISTITDFKLEVLATDCGRSELKIRQWNAL